MNQIIIPTDVLDRFKLFLLFEERTENTIGKYLRDAKKFLAFVDDKPLSKELLIAYKEMLKKEKYAPRSINSMIASVNTLLRFMERDDLKIKNLKIQQQIFCPENKLLTRDEYFQLIRQAEAKNDIRLSLVLQTICSTGIRVSELGFVTVESARLGEAVVYCKGKARVIIFVRGLQKKLLDYANANSIVSGPVFVNEFGCPLTRGKIWYDMKTLSKQADINPEKVFPHNLRHLFARMFYDMDNDIVKLADVLGHSSINTTRIYIMSSGKEHRNKMESLELIEK